MTENCKGKRDRRTEGKRERWSSFQMTGMAVAVIGHLRPSFQTHSVMPSPPYFLTACVCYVASSFNHDDSFYIVIIINIWI